MDSSNFLCLYHCFLLELGNRLYYLSITITTETSPAQMGCIRTNNERKSILSLLNRVGCVVTWVTWVRGFGRCVGCIGQIFTWVAWVKYFCVGPIFICVDLCVGQNFLRGSKIFARVNLFLRWSTFIY